MDILENLQKRTGEEDDELLAVLLDDAKNAILARRFPYGSWPEEIEPQYLDLQYRIALDLYNKQGAEGQTLHLENGVHRTYESSWISKQLLQEVTPYAGVIS